MDDTAQDSAKKRKRVREPLPTAVTDTPVETSAPSVTQEPAAAPAMVPAPAPVVIPPQRSIMDKLREYLSAEAHLLEEYPDLADDDVALRDTLEGITDLNEAIVYLGIRQKKQEAEAAGIKVFADQFVARAQTAKKKAERTKDFIHFLMTQSKIQEAQTSLAKVTMQQGQLYAKGEITDKTPDDYFEVEKKPNRGLITQALKDGFEVPGFKLEPGDPFVVIRVGTPKKK